jgi:hypothetical protein
LVLDLGLLAIAYGIAAILPTWQWWAAYAIIPVVGFGAVAWVFISGSHDSTLILIAIAAPVFVGAAGGLIARAILFVRPGLANAARWTVLALGLAVTIALAIWVF